MTLTLYRTWRRLKDQADEAKTKRGTTHGTNKKGDILARKNLAPPTNAKVGEPHARIGGGTLRPAHTLSTGQQPDNEADKASAVPN